MTEPTPEPISAPTAAPPFPPQPSAPPHPHRPNGLELFLGFAKIAVCGFGGVLAWSRRVVVQERAWMGAEEFNEQLALCQVLPGPNIVNFSIMFGSRSAGVLGALAALMGLIGPPVILMIVAGSLYGRYGHLPALTGILTCLAAAAAGLPIATSAQMIGTMVRRGLRPGHIVAVIAFIAAGVLRLPLLWVMAVLVPVSIGLTWWERR
jgi:chromate transporter